MNRQQMMQWNDLSPAGGRLASRSQLQKLRQTNAQTEKKRNMRRVPIRIATLGALLASSFFVLQSDSAPGGTVTYQSAAVERTSQVAASTVAPRKPVITHLKTPNPLKAIYMTSWVAGTSEWRAQLVRLIEETEINAVVIDIKDYTGRVAIAVDDPELQEIGSSEVRIPDVREFLALLHSKGIYTIARIAVFQDPYFVKKYPELAVKRASDHTVAWKDRKGISWVDVGATQMWEYAVALGKEAYAAGFDELNYDYIRFPSDGDMNDIYYPFSEEKIRKDPSVGKARVLRNFFGYLYDHLHDSGAVLSVDLFGMTTTNSDDLGIGQVLEYALPYFDYIAPMVYPSHYPNGFIGLSNPAAHPYEVIKHSMDAAVLRAQKASTTALKIRPWLQDFDLGADYTADMVRAQMQATYDAGLTSWMLWDPANRYTRSALLNE
jgi:hypothetical protein